MLALFNVKEGKNNQKRGKQRRRRKSMVYVDAQTRELLEAVSEEALDLDHERKTLLKKLIQAAQTSEEDVDRVLEEAGDLLIETAFVDYLDGEAQRLAAESDAEGLEQSCRRNSHAEGGGRGGLEYDKARCGVEKRCT